VLLAPCVLFPGRLLPTRLQPCLLLALFLFWPLRLFAGQRAQQLSPLSLGLGALLFWLPLNLWASVDRSRSWQAAGYLLLGIALYGAFCHWLPTRQKPQWLAWGMILVGMGLSLLGPLLLIAEGKASAPLGLLQPFVQPIAQRLGETINPNILAGGLVLIIPLVFALCLRWDWAPRQWLPLSLGLLAVGMVAILSLAQSRGAELAIVLALGTLLVVRWPRLLYGLPFVICLLLIIIYWLGPRTVGELLTANDTIGGLDQRTEIWLRARYALADFPFTGIGIGTFDLVIPLLYPYFTVPTGVTIPHAHNLFLQIAVDLGLPGLIAWLSLQINLFVMLGQLLRRRNAALTWVLSAGALGALIAMLVHGLVDAPLWGSKIAFLPWLLYALVTLLYTSSETVTKE
jgi:putative inorganic carbon (hco3(-)) transporter